MNTEALDERGIGPLREGLAQLAAIDSREALIEALGRSQLDATASPFGWYVGADRRDPDRHQLVLSLGGIGLPDRDYYLKDTATYREARAKYKEYLAFLLGKAGYTDPAAAANAVFSLETRIAQEHWNRATYRERDLTYNKVPAAELSAYGSAGLMPRMLQGLGAKADYAIVYDLPPTAEEMKSVGMTAADAAAKIGGGSPAFVRLVEQVPVSTWQAWLTARFLSDNA